MVLTSFVTIWVTSSHWDPFPFLMFAWPIWPPVCSCVPTWAYPYTLTIGRADHVLNNVGDWTRLFEVQGTSPPGKASSYHFIARGLVPKRTFHRGMINPCVHSGAMAIPSDWTGSFSLTCCGGRSYSGSKPIPYPYVGSHSRLSSDAVGSSVMDFSVIGFLAHGWHLRSLCPLPTKSFLRWLWLLISGAPPGLPWEWSFCAITKLWCPF